MNWFAVLMCILVTLVDCDGAEIYGAIRVTSTKAALSDFDKIVPPPYSSATLCSNDRAYRVAGDRGGTFLFRDVLPGQYTLVTTGGASGPEAVQRIDVAENSHIGPIAALVHMGMRTSPCFVTSYGAQIASDFEVTYGAVDVKQRVPLIEGQVLRKVTRRSSVSTKPMREVTTELFRSGETIAVVTAKSGARGRFRITPPEPGTYELVTSHTGYQSVHVPRFLVPRQNATVITVTAATSNSIVIQR